MFDPPIALGFHPRFLLLFHLCLLASLVPSIVPSTVPATVPSMVPSMGPSVIPSIVPPTVPFLVPFVGLCSKVCVESDWPVLDCRGGLSSLSPLPSFQSVAMLVGVSVWAVWTSVLCLCLFRFCSGATVYKICAWLQLTAGFCLALACLLFPDSWESPEMRALCGDSVGSFSLGNCSVHWAYILAILGILDAAILATLAFVLANRQDALLPPDAKEGEETSAGLASGPGGPGLASGPGGPGLASGPGGPGLASGPGGPGLASGPVGPGL
uniref:LHFPL tetraspan subfamily member 4b n=1 Tax=Gasterosteus aculeatus aculeatus TaxID=481459 RepID=A0AAQ4PFG6_GASAC